MIFHGFLIGFGSILQLEGAVPLVGGSPGSVVPTARGVRGHRARHGHEADDRPYGATAAATSASRGVFIDSPCVSGPSWRMSCHVVGENWMVN